MSGLDAVPLVRLNAIRQAAKEAISVAPVFGGMHREHKLAIASFFDPYARIGSHPVVRVNEVVLLPCHTSRRRDRVSRDLGEEIFAVVIAARALLRKRQVVAGDVRVLQLGNPCAWTRQRLLPCEARLMRSSTALSSRRRTSEPASGLARRT